jgi:pimeloyl-ACP methyl ester carboxylesterase
MAALTGRGNDSVDPAVRRRPAPVLRTVLVAVGVAVAVMFAGTACSSGSTSTPTNRGTVTPTATRSPVTTDAAGQPVTLPACVNPGEGRYLPAVGPSGPAPALLLGSGPQGIVLGAQANGGLCQMLPFGRELAAKGYHVAVFSWTVPYADAMTNATRALLADGAQQVVLGGFSRGGLVGLGIAQSLAPHVVGVFSVSGGPSAAEGFPIVASLSVFRGPILLIWSEQDPVFPADTDALIAAAHDEPETMLMISGRGHALALLDGPDGVTVRAAVDEFLRTVLR